MDAYRLSAAGSALALHVALLAGVLSFATAPAIRSSPEPVQVVLLSTPQPLPVVRAPTRPAAEPPRAALPEPTAATPAPEPARPVPSRARTTTAAAPAPTRSAMATPPKPPPGPAPPAESAPIPIPIQPATPSPSNAPATQGGASAPASAAAGPATSAPVAVARDAVRHAARSAPHVDATWSGNLPPPYPGMARRMGDQGEVRLDVHVGADGTVTEVRLRQSSGSTLLDRTAIDTVRKWRFKPAMVDGQPVAEWYHDWRWVFRLEG